MSEWEELKDRNFHRTAWGLDTTQSAGQRIKEFCVSAIFTAIILIFVFALLRGLINSDNRSDGDCDPGIGLCEGP
jgi:hypothetical protein